MDPICTVAQLLAQAKLEHVEISASMNLAQLTELYDSGRPALLSALKEAGLAKLPERQALANTLGKAARAGALKPAAREEPRPPTTAALSWRLQNAPASRQSGWSGCVYCCRMRPMQLTVDRRR